MSAFDDLIEMMLEGERVDAVTIGPFGWGGYKAPPEDQQPPIGNLLNWEQAQEYLKTMPSFSGGYGAPECYAIHVWTNKRVYFVGTYDGATWLTHVPRNPSGEQPHMIGGG